MPKDGEVGDCGGESMFALGGRVGRCVSVGLRKKSFEKPRKNCKNPYASFQ
tara:strand:- start:145 stop:297 length:153 start_codon:yes stop_codon:yes gene_type:complete